MVDGEAAETAKYLEVPEALIWLAMDGVDFKLVDELIAWWPQPTMRQKRRA